MQRFFECNVAYYFFYSQVVCGGHGTCNCGECNCDVGYKGRHCESCPVSNLMSFPVIKGRS